MEAGDVTTQLEVVDGDGFRMEEDRITKKVRFKEGIREEAMDVVVKNASNPKISWKDKLLGTNSVSLENEGSFSLSDESVEDLEFLEGDIRISTINGTPAIDFSERIQQILFKEMESTVVIKLLGRNIGYEALSNRINSLWNPSKPFHLMDFENGYYLAKFHSVHDYTKVLSQGPWLVYGQYLTVQPWTKEFDSSQPFPSIVLAWIRLPGLPGFLYKKEILQKIGGLIGKVVRLDINTDNRTRGCFARMAVYINLNKPLTAQVLVNGMKQRVEYEALPAICYNCGKYGHTKELCPLLRTEASPGRIQTENISASAEKGGEGDTYGPWMVVNRKSRKNAQKNNIFITSNNGNGVQENMPRDRSRTNKGIQLEGAKTLKELPATQNISRFNALAEHAQNTNEADWNKKLSDNLDHNKLQATNKEGPPCIKTKSIPTKNLIPCAGKSYSLNNEEPNGADGHSMPSKIGSTSTTLVEVQMKDSLGSLINNRHTAVTFKEQGPNGSVIKNRVSGKSMGGCASNKFLRAFREYNLEYKPDIVCLLEPRVSGHKATSIIDKLGFDRSHRIESVGFSGGIWVGWKDSITISIIHNHPQFMLLNLKVNAINNGFFIFVVYGSPDRIKRQALWDDLMDVLPQDPLPWMILGDFNAILSPEDKKSDRSTGFQPNEKPDDHTFLPIRTPLTSAAAQGRDEDEQWQHGSLKEKVIKQRFWRGPPRAKG
ncbi:reverse transcriptase [Gossypium australe]|uniref:Reverse transcriptase n=1 Tax=Gossypium australe TaxID=47621 RepID=A0A5B6X3K5_9ROSI|nr:reverse transcriptase [Gossypium australe]